MAGGHAQLRGWKSAIKAMCQGLLSYFGLESNLNIFILPYHPQVKITRTFFLSFNSIFPWPSVYEWITMSFKIRLKITFLQNICLKDMNLPTWLTTLSYELFLSDLAECWRSPLKLVPVKTKNKHLTFEMGSPAEVRGQPVLHKACFLRSQFPNIPRQSDLYNYLSASVGCIHAD